MQQQTARTDAEAAAAQAAAAAVAEAAASARASSPDSSGGLREDVEEALKNCLVLVDVDIPLVALSDGVHSRSFAGNGLVVWHGDSLGLVLVSWQLLVLQSCKALHLMLSSAVGPPVLVYAHTRAEAVDLLVLACSSSRMTVSDV
jgi:hypothetical protein